MIRHFAIAALRNIAANKLISAIAILGLAVGIAAALLMAAVIRNQLSFDHFVPNHERTYIAVTRDNPHFVKPEPCGDASYCQRGPTNWASELKLAVPEIEAVTRLAYTAAFGSDEPLPLQAGRVSAREMLYWADPNAFDVLPLPVLHGDLAAALTRPDGIVLPRAMALKYFGRDDVVGRTILLEGHPMIVRAVIRDLPVNGTTLMSGIFAAGTAAFSPIAPNRVGGPPVYTYLRLKPGVSAAAIEDKITAIARIRTAAMMRLANQPRNLVVGKLLRLDRANLDEFNNPGISARLAAAALAGLMVLLIALVNFVNLTTARSARREKDVGVRKACGAGRTILMAQFLGEAMLAVLLAIILALTAGEWLMPAVNAFLRTGARLSDPLLPLLLAGVLVSGLAAGAWPAFVLSGFRPAGTLRGWSTGEGAGLIHSMLVALQFAMLITLAIAAAVVWQQRGYATTEALQVDSSNVVMVRTNPPPKTPWPRDIRSPQACPAAFRDAVRRLPEVRDARCTAQTFLIGRMWMSWFAKSGVLQTVVVNQVDPGIFGLYGVKPVAGTLADTNGTILNLAAVKLLGYSSPEAAVGQDWLDRVTRDDLQTYRDRIGGHSRITAVVPDFTFAPVTNAVTPAIFSAWQESPPARIIHIKLNGNDMPQTLAAIDRAWRSSGQAGAIDRVFVRDYVAQFYQDMLREAQFFSAFAVIAIVLSCFGLFGVAVASAERRTKEIGVRKAMGARDWQVTALLLWQFAQPVLWANVIAWPAAWWLMQRWLAGYSRHIELQPGLFLAASAVALLVALAAVAGQAWIAARARPVLALRYE